MHREERYQVHSHKYGIFHAFRNTTTTKARGSVWSIGHRRPLAIALCSGLILLLLSSLYLAAWALPQCLASSCCEVGLSSSFPAGSRSELGMWWWMLASRGCVRSSPTSSSEFVLLLVPVPLAPTALHLGSSLAIGCCRCAVERYWRILDFLQHCLCRPPSFASVEQDWLHIGVEDAKFGSCPDLLGRPDVLEHDKSCSGLASPGCDISVRAPPSVNCTPNVDEGIHFPDGLFTDCDWCVGSGWQWLAVHLGMPFQNQIKKSRDRRNVESPLGIIK